MVHFKKNRKLFSVEKSVWTHIRGNKYGGIDILGSSFQYQILRHSVTFHLANWKWVYRMTWRPSWTFSYLQGKSPQQMASVF